MPRHTRDRDEHHRHRTGSDKTTYDGPLVEAPPGSIKRSSQPTKTVAYLGHEALTNLDALSEVLHDLPGAEIEMALPVGIRLLSAISLDRIRRGHGGAPMDRDSPKSPKDILRFAMNDPLFDSEFANSGTSHAVDEARVMFTREPRTQREGMSQLVIDLKFDVEPDPNSPGNRILRERRYFQMLSSGRAPTNTSQMPLIAPVASLWVPSRDTPPELRSHSIREALAAVAPPVVEFGKLAILYTPPDQAGRV